LCEEAHTLIRLCLQDGSGLDAALEIMDIADDPSLMDRYGTTIPVLRNDAAGLELNWPFDMADIRKIL
jgi:hypothetical protein